MQNLNLTLIVPFEYSPNETTSTMENVLFANITKDTIGKSKVSSFNKVIDFIAKDWGLNPNNVKQFKTIKTIITNSAKYN